MTLKETFLKGIKYTRLRKKIKKLEKKLENERDGLSKEYLELGKKIKELDYENLNKDSYIKIQLDSMNNILNMIEKLDKENNEFIDNISVKKKEYDKKINEYPGLINNLNEKIVNPSERLATSKEELSLLKIQLKDTRKQIKDKEKVFSDNEKIMSQNNEEHLLNEEKKDSLITEQERVEKELLTLTQKFEELTDKSSKIKFRITTLDNQISASQKQISIYKKEESYLKKEKLREINTINKLVKNNENSIEMRFGELKHIYMSIGSACYENKLFADSFIEEFKKIEEINNKIKKMSENKYLNYVKSSTEEKWLILKFYSIIAVVIIFLLLIVFISIYFINASKELSPEQNNVPKVEEVTTK